MFLKSKFTCKNNKKIVPGLKREQFFFRLAVVLALMYIMCFTPFKEANHHILLAKDEMLRLNAAQPPKDVQVKEETEKKDIIRFHVKAHSNNPLDQQIKNAVAVNILNKHGHKLGNLNSQEKLRRELIHIKADLKEMAEAVIKKRGEIYEADVKLKTEHFPARMYAGEIYPAGNYEALIISLGKGRGENWWCVLFPPLCFNVFLAEEEAAEDEDNLNFEKDKTSNSCKDIYDNKDDDKGKEKMDLRFWLKELLSR